MNPDEYRIMYELEEDYWWYRGMRAITSTVLARVVGGEPGGRHLDAGCGTGANLKFLGRRYESYGLEISAEAMPFLARDGHSRVARASVLAVPFADKCFDLVTAFEVVQAVDDASALQELHRVTRPGGYVIIREAALDALAGEHDQAGATVRRYTRRELEEKIRQAGFRIVFSSYANFMLLPPIYFLRTWRRMLGKKVEDSLARTDFRFSPSRLNRLFLACLQAEAAWLRRFSLPVGVSLIVVGKKEKGVRA